MSKRLVMNFLLAIAGVVTALTGIEIPQEVGISVVALLNAIISVYLKVDQKNKETVEKVQKNRRIQAIQSFEQNRINLNEFVERIKLNA